MKKWKLKFPGMVNEGEEDPYVTAQRFVNVYRQLHVLREDLVSRYNDMLLEIDSEARSTLTDIPGGREVRDYLEYLEHQKYGDDYVSEEDDEIYVSREEKAKARAIADALSSAQEKMNQNQIAVMQQAQEDARRNIEILARTLSEAKQDPSRRSEVASLTESLKKAKENYTVYTNRLNEEESSSETAEYIPSRQKDDVVQEGLEELSESGNKGLEALISALTEAQVKSAEIQAKAQSEALAKIFSQSQEMTARAMAEAFARSQQNAAELQGNLIAKAIADSQRNANETLMALFSGLQKNGGAIKVSSDGNAPSANSQAEMIHEQAKVMAQAQVEAQKELFELQKKAIAENPGLPASTGFMSAAEQAKMIADVVAQTQSNVLTQAMGQMMHRQEESQRFQATLMAEAFSKQTQEIALALSNAQKAVRNETLATQAQAVAQAMIRAQNATQSETISAQARAIAKAMAETQNELQVEALAKQARVVAEAVAESQANVQRDVLAEQARVVAEAVAESQANVQADVLAKQARVVAEAVAESQGAVQRDVLAQQAQVVAQAMAESQGTVQRDVLAEQARVVAEAMAESHAHIQRDALAEQARVVAEAISESQSSVQADVLAEQARVVAQAMAQQQNVSLAETVDLLAQKQMDQTSALASVLAQQQSKTQEALHNLNQGEAVQSLPSSDNTDEKNSSQKEKKAETVQQQKSEPLPKKKVSELPKIDLSNWDANLDETFLLSQKAAEAAGYDLDDNWGLGYGNTFPGQIYDDYQTSQDEYQSLAESESQTSVNYAKTDVPFGQTQESYTDANGQSYYLDAEGKPYYLDEQGQAYYVDENGNSYYVDAEGKPYYVDEQGQAYYVDENGEVVYFTPNISSGQTQKSYTDANGQAY